MPAAAALMAATTNSTTMETETKVLPVENASKATISDDHITDILPKYLSGIEEIQQDFAASVDQAEEADERRIELMNLKGPNESSCGENKDLSIDSEVGMRGSSFTDEIGDNTCENVLELNGLVGNISNDDNITADGIGEDFVVNADRESRKTAFEIFNDLTNGVLENNPVDNKNPDGVRQDFLQTANMASGKIASFPNNFSGN